MAPATRLVLLIGWLGYALMPWYLVEGMSLTNWAWLAEYPFGKGGQRAGAFPVRPDTLAPACRHRARRP